jgi:hypothetical protein
MNGLPDGRLVDLLLEAGHPVVPVSPNSIKTCRDGGVLSGGIPRPARPAASMAAVAESAPTTSRRDEPRRER